MGRGVGGVYIGTDLKMTEALELANKCLKPLIYMCS